MAGVRFADVQSRPTEFLDFTSLTLDEFQQLVPPFEAAFQAHMAAWRFDGKPRTARRFTVYTELPLADARRPAVLSPHVSQDLRAPGGPGTPLRHAPEQSQSVDPRALARAAGGPARPRRCPRPLPRRPGAAPWRLGGRGGGGRHIRWRRSTGGGASACGRGPRRRAGAPPCTIKEELRSGKIELDIGDPPARSASSPLHLECLKRTCTRARDPLGYLS